MDNQDKKTAKTQSFDLMKIDNKQLVHLDQFEAKLKKLVKDNPFIEITDKATLEIARKRRSALTTARLELRTTGKKESQESILMKKIGEIKDFVKGKIDHLVTIPATAEDKQDAEIKRFEKILQDEKDRKDQEEADRVDGIKGEIDRVIGELEAITEKMKFDTIPECGIEFKEKAFTIVDLMEFAFLFDEMITEQQNVFDAQIEALKTAEKERIENESKSQVAKTNEIYLAVQTKIDEHGMESDPEALIKSINDEFDVDFDFGVHKTQFEAKRADYLAKATEKIDALKQLDIADQKQKIFNVREGLLDMVFQMDVDNHAKVTEYVKEALEQNTIPEVKEDFEKMKTIVEKSLSQKLKLLAGEIKAKENKLIERLNQRIKIVEDLGLVGDADEKEWTGFESKVFVDDLFNYNDDEFDGLLEEIKEAKQDDENEKARQKRIRQDKITMIDAFVQVKNTLFETEPGSFENEETFVYFSTLRKQMIELCDSNIVQINKF